MGSNLPPLDDDFDSGLGNLADKMRENILKQSRIALALVGVLTVAYAAYQLMKLNTELAQFDDYVLEAISSEIASAKLIIHLTIGIGAVFLGFAVMIYRYPLTCTLGGLVIFVLGIVAGAVIDPETLSHGLIMRFAIIAVLVKGVKTAIVYSKELKIEEEKHRALATAKVISE